MYILCRRIDANTNNATSIYFGINAYTDYR